MKNVLRFSKQVAGISCQAACSKVLTLIIKKEMRIVSLLSCTRRRFFFTSRYFELLYLKYLLKALVCWLFLKRSDQIPTQSNSSCHSVKTSYSKAERMLRSNLEKKPFYTGCFFYSVKKYNCHLWLLFCLQWNQITLQN